MRAAVLPALLVASFVLLAAGPTTGAPSGEATPPSDALLADLPFIESQETNRIYVDLAPEGNDRPLRILLDTGAGYSAYSPLAARAAGVSVRRTKSSPYRRKTRLGRDLHFVVDTSSSDTGTRMGWEYGLLGCNFLEHFVLELDFAARRVRFYDPDRYAVPEAVASPDEVVLPMPLNGRRPMVELPVEGTPVRFLIDTGAPYPLMVAGSVASKAGLSFDLGELQSTMIIGPVAMRLGEAKRVAFGSIELTDVPMVVMPRGAYNWAGPNDSILGYDTLAEFTVRFDWPRRRLWMKRRADASATFLGARWSTYRTEGVLLIPRGVAHEVGIVAAGSAASRRGVRPGDRLEEGQLPERFVAALRDGEEVVVVRRTDDDVWMDVVLEATTEP